jgi:hypothetical protein
MGALDAEAYIDVVLHTYTHLQPPKAETKDTPPEKDTVGRENRDRSL